MLLGSDAVRRVRRGLRLVTGKAGEGEQTSHHADITVSAEGVAMRIAVGGLMHETNTFAKDSTTLDDFKAYRFAVGSQLFGYARTQD